MHGGSSSIPTLFDSDGTPAPSPEGISIIISTLPVNVLPVPTFLCPDHLLCSEEKNLETNLFIL